MRREEGDRLDLELEAVDEVDVRIVAGDVTVTAGGTGSVRVEVEVLRGPPATIELEGGRLVVEHQPERSLGALLGGGAAAQANVSVLVPEQTETRVRTVSGDVFVGGITTRTSVTTVSGRITATGLDGEIGLRTVSGDMDVQGVSGTVRSNAVSGDLTINGGDPIEVTARSVSGEVTLDLDGVPDVDCTTVSGDVAVRLPSDAALDFDAVTVSGRLETSFPDRLDSSKRRLRGRIGGGGPRVAARTTSGDVIVLRRASVPSS